MAGVVRRMLDRLGASGAINFAAIGETRQQGQGSAKDARRLGRCKDHARPLCVLCNSHRGEASKRCPTPPAVLVQSLDTKLGPRRGMLS